MSQGLRAAVETVGTDALSLPVAIVIGVLAVSAALWCSSLVIPGAESGRRPTRDAVRRWSAALGLLALAAGCLLTDFPVSSGAGFWAAHPLLTGVLTTCALLGVGSVFVDRHENRQTLERELAQRRRARELDAQADAIRTEMLTSLVSDIFLILVVFTDYGAERSITRARESVAVQREVVADSLSTARVWFVALTGTRNAGATKALAMLTRYMATLRGAEYAARTFDLQARDAVELTVHLRKALDEMHQLLVRAESIVRTHAEAEGLSYEELVTEELTRRQAAIS